MLIVHDKDEIEAFLRKDVYLHLYGIGDLDDFFWNYTTWYASKKDGQVEAIILFYSGGSLPVVLALDGKTEPIHSLLQSVLHLFPLKFYAHLSPGLDRAIKQPFTLESFGEHYKMALVHEARLDAADTAMTTRLSADDLPAVLTLYESSYPGNWFDERMMETGHYYGIWGNGDLVSIAGIHVYSQQYGVAALGNITTRPDQRGKGLGRAVTARLCKALLPTVSHIGLNVKCDNYSAIALYRNLGFEIIGSYNEFLIKAQ